MITETDYITYQMTMNAIADHCRNVPEAKTKQRSFLEKNGELPFYRTRTVTDFLGYNFRDNA